MAGWWCNNHLEKYEFVNGKDYGHIQWKVKAMFQTTNQWDMWDFNLYLLSSGGFISFHIFPS
jgi:hypothetical protein